MPVVVVDISPFGVENAETAAEIPQRPTPASFFPQIEAITHPGKCNRVGRLVECAPFADVGADSFLFEFLPGQDALLAQFLPGGALSFAVLLWPRWLGPLVGPGFPTRLVVTDLHGCVTARALRDSKVRQPKHRIAAPSKAVGDDQSVDRSQR